MKNLLANCLIREWVFVILGLGLLLLANVMSPWESSTLLTVLFAVAGVILLVKGGEQHGRNMVNKYNTAKDKTDDV